LSDFDSIYPIDVYRYVSDHGVRLADGAIDAGHIVGGTVLPPFTRVLAEAIAATRPRWARFEDTTIGPEVRSDDYKHVYICWVRSFSSRVAVVQEVAYQWTGETIGPTSFPSVKAWTDAQFELELGSGSDAYELATALHNAAALLDELDRTARP